MKIEELDANNTKDINELKKLIKVFCIDTFVQNKKEFINKSTKQKRDLIQLGINDYEKDKSYLLLTEEDKKHISKNIENITQMMEKTYRGENQIDNFDFRYYLLKDDEKDDKLVGFQVGQVYKDTGYRIHAYTVPEYRRYIGSVKDTDGNETRQDYYSVLLYDEITKWFEEKNIKEEKTSTGEYMNRNIFAYVVGLHFMPKYKKDNNLYFSKTVGRELDKEVYKKIYDEYVKNQRRDKYKDSKDLLEEVNNIKEFEDLSLLEKKELTNTYLKEDEKKFPLSKLEQMNEMVMKAYNMGIKIKIQDAAKALKTEVENIKSIFKKEDTRDFIKQDIDKKEEANKRLEKDIRFEKLREERENNKLKRTKEEEEQER